MFDSISFENYRSIRKLHVDLKPINVLFGPNGSGKSTLLSGFSLLLDSVKGGLADSLRIAGGVSNLRSFGMERNEATSVGAIFRSMEYGRRFDWKDHRIDGRGRERLVTKEGTGELVIFDSDGSGLIGQPYDEDQYISPIQWHDDRSLWESIRREVNRILPDVLKSVDVLEFYMYLKSSRSFACRRLPILDLAERGSVANEGVDIAGLGSSMWSVLRNLRDARMTYGAYEKIRGYLKIAFPNFDDFELQSVAQTVVCNVVEKSRNDPYPVAFASDGLVHMAFCLTTLFCGTYRSAAVLLDEPDLSLHPWALTVLADAIKEATSKWNRQVILATHSPTLLSEFKEDEILLMQSGENGVTATRVSDIQEDRDLLDRYDLGSLYQMNIIGKQGDKPLYTEVDATE